MMGITALSNPRIRHVESVCVKLRLPVCVCRVLSVVGAVLTAVCILDGPSGHCVW